MHCCAQAKTRWQFFQPFQGGTAFVATQGAGWALFAASLVSLVWLVLHVAAGMAAGLVAGIRYWILATGFTIFAAQISRTVGEKESCVPGPTPSTASRNDVSPWTGSEYRKVS